MVSVHPSTTKVKPLSAPLVAVVIVGTVEGLAQVGQGVSLLFPAVQLAAPAVPYTAVCQPFRIDQGR